VNNKSENLSSKSTKLVFTFVLSQDKTTKVQSLSNNPKIKQQRYSLSQTIPR